MSLAVPLLGLILDEFSIDYILFSELSIFNLESLKLNLKLFCFGLEVCLFWFETGRQAAGNGQEEQESGMHYAQFCGCFCDKPPNLC